MDFSDFENSFIGMPADKFLKKCGSPESVHMITDRDLNIQKKYIYPDFIVHVQNDMCISISERPSGDL